MKQFFLIYFLVVLPHFSVCQTCHPIRPDSVRWLREMTVEVNSIVQPQDSFIHWMSELRLICKNQRNYILQRPRAVSLCRRVVRLGIRENAGFPTAKYIQLLEQLSGYFHESNDTLVALTLELERNRLFYEKNRTFELVGEIASKETDRLFGLFGADGIASRIRLLWLSNYLFGRHGLSSRTEAELSIEYIKYKNNFTAGLFYWERANYNRNKLINDANTNWAYKFMRDFVVTPFLDKLGEQDKYYLQQLKYRELLFHCDQSKIARSARREILTFVEINRCADIMSALLYRELGIDYLSQNDLNYAIHYFQRSVNDYNQCAESRKDTLLWANTLYLLGTAFERSGNVKGAKKAFEQTAQLLEGHSSIDLSRYFALVAVARLSISQGERYSTRRTIGAIETILNGLGDAEFNFDFLPDIGTEYRNKQQVTAILYTSYFRLRAQEFESIDIGKAIDCAYYAKRYLDNVNMSDNYFYYQIQLLLARLQLKEEGMLSSHSGRALAPASLLQSCIDAYLQGKTIELPDAAMAYNLFAEMSIREGKEAEAAANYRNTYQIITNYAIRHLLTMTESNRAKFWEKVKPVLTQTLKGCIDHAETMPSLTEIAFDCSLFMKGLLLQSSNELRNIVYESKNRALITQYEQMLQQQELEQQSEYLNTHTEELELLHYPQVVAGLEKIKTSLFFCFDNLKNILKDDEIAIELVETNRLFDDRSIQITDRQYGAILVTRNKGACYVPLARGKELINITPQDNSLLYNYIWKPLEQEINGYRSIYFSAAGLLYNLPLENAISKDGRIMSQHSAVFRLSSLRQLIEKKRKDNDKAAIFGGLSYHLSTSELQNKTATGLNVFRDLPNVASLRFAEREIEELPGTAEEASFLYQLLRRHNIPTSLNEKNLGTEDVFKQLSGKKVTLLHIGTHGFVDTEGLSISDENVFLSHCGLLFAGAANTIYSENFSGGSIDDGILTAREICSMDLRGLDIAVLSACKTGTGKIGSDGVFGLQRGFKKAGVQSILMSLWNVDDEATCMLMKEFYRNWISLKKTKYDALESAKQVVRSHKEKGWDDPKYWAAFILLDALD